jgi:hypothetical protein
MQKERNTENERAHRIAIRMNSCHVSLTNIYEKLVDREFDGIDKEAKYIIMELRFILKALEDDDF